MMRALIRGAHDIWCAVTSRCRITPPDDDPEMVWLREREITAKRNTRHARQNAMERLALIERQRAHGSQ